jgi:hypothetical protein
VVEAMPEATAPAPGRPAHLRHDRLLAAIAEHRGITQSAVLELLIRKEAEALRLRQSRRDL